MTRPCRPILHPLVHMLVVLVLATAPGVCHGDGWDIDQLMNSLAQVQSNHARFVEKKSIAMLEEPVVASGELFYVAPDHLEKRTLKPKHESIILNDDTLVLEYGDRKRRLSLPDHPELAPFIESIRGTLAGDRQALERHYRLKLEGTPRHWTLQLIPVGDEAQKVVRRIRITGMGNALHSIRITQADGDSSLMVIKKSNGP